MSVTLYIFGSVLLIGLASLVGVFTISLRQERLNRALAFLIPIAVGALLGDAFFHLLPEAFEEAAHPARVSFFVLLGIFSFFYLEKFLRRHHHSVAEATADEHDNPRHLGNLILASDGLHNFIDGIIIGASYLVSIEVGIATTLAVILHEIPQEIGDFGILIYAGFKRTTALFYNFLSALTAVAGAVLVLLVGSLPEQLLIGVIPFAAGIFIYIASSDIVPELQKNERGKNIIPELFGFCLGLFAMYFLLFLE